MPQVPTPAAQPVISLRSSPPAFGDSSEVCPAWEPLCPSSLTCFCFRDWTVSLCLSLWVPVPVSVVCSPSCGHFTLWVHRPFPSPSPVSRVPLPSPRPFGLRVPLSLLFLCLPAPNMACGAPSRGPCHFDCAWGLMRGSGCTLHPVIASSGPWPRDPCLHPPAPCPPSLPTPSTEGVGTGAPLCPPSATHPPNLPPLWPRAQACLPGSCGFEGGSIPSFRPPRTEG